MTWPVWKRWTPRLVSFQAALEPRLSGSLVGFLVRPRDRFFVPTCSASGTPRADAVKAGRRSGASTNSGIASPRLDGGEHGDHAARDRDIGDLLALGGIASNAP